MLIKILAALAVIVAAFAVIVAMQPLEFRVARTTTISAPASALLAQVNDFRNWQAWSPYHKLDPAMIKNLRGCAIGNERQLLLG